MASEGDHVFSLSDLAVHLLFMVHFEAPRLNFRLGNAILQFNLVRFARTIASTPATGAASCVTQVFAARLEWACDRLAGDVSHLTFI